MRWPETTRLIDRIRRERPELIVDHHGGDGHYTLRVYCILKQGRRLIPESVDTLYGPDGWVRYKERHPEPWCSPADSYHTDALGREVDHRGRRLGEIPPPCATPLTAEAMLGRIVALNHSDPDWWKSPEKVSDLAAAWGVRTKAHGIMADYDLQEVARLSGDCHASILIARSGSGLFASGYVARWGNGGMHMEPSVGAVPFDSEFEARRAAFKELIAAIATGRGAARNQERQLLLAAVKERDRDRGLFG